MIETYIPTKGKRRKEAPAVAETEGWQLQYAGVSKSRSHTFRVVDVRDPRARLRDPAAPARRVWEVYYNHKSGRVTGPHAAALSDFYPHALAWAREEMSKYWVEAGLRAVSIIKGERVA